MEEIKISCPKCDNQMEWQDTIETSGGILENYVEEIQVWSCENCNHDYTVQLRAELRQNDIEVQGIRY